MCAVQLVPQIASLFLFSICIAGSYGNSTTTTSPVDANKFLENKSLIGMKILCTEEEKQCYKFNRVHYVDGKCYTLFQHGPCSLGAYHTLRFDKERFFTGHYEVHCLISTCETSGQEIMAYDQGCYNMKAVKEICNEKKGFKFSRNIFGEGECQCEGPECSPRPSVTQPAEAGHCRLPDFTQATYPVWIDTLASVSIMCSVREHACFEEGKLLYESDGKCYTPLEQGPCSEDKQFVANTSAFEHSLRLVGECAPRSCPEGELRLMSDNTCVPREVLNDTLCPPHLVMVDVFGNAGCNIIRRGAAPQLPTVRYEFGICRRVDEPAMIAGSSGLFSGSGSIFVILFSLILWKMSECFHP